ncbi:MAG: MltA domain-containing protein, partial [Pseudomonadota bacterium]
MQTRCHILLVLAAWLLSGCTTAPTPVQSPVQEVETFTPELKVPSTSDAFLSVSVWADASVVPGLEAMRRSCSTWNAKAADQLLSRRAPWAGTPADWRGFCEALSLVEDEDAARRVIEALAVPVEVRSPDGASRFTGYFEPMIPARRAPVGVFNAAVPGPPADLVQTDNGPSQRLPNGSLRAYPPRKDIRPDAGGVLGYAHPADVFFLQIQGSGRLLFPDGSTVRAAYFAHNGQPFRSTANWLLERGEIGRGEASMQGIKAWMDTAGPDKASEAMNANPRYVFFQELPEGDPDLGPNGAMGVPLTALGSVAVDPSVYPLGLPLVVSTTAPGLGGDWSGLVSAQDTGGAIKGVVRGDIYFGTGD